MSQIKQNIDTKKDMLTKMEEIISSLLQLKQLQLEKQRENDNLGVQNDFLRQEINERTKRLGALKAGNIAAKTVLRK